MKNTITERCLNFSILSIKIIKQLPKDNIFQIIYKQIIRSITSIGANVNEAQSASTKKDFTNFYVIALKSANESYYWLQILFELLPGQNSKLSIIENELSQISKIIAASILTLKNKKNNN